MTIRNMVLRTFLFELRAEVISAILLSLQRSNSVKFLQPETKNRKFFSTSQQCKSAIAFSSIDINRYIRSA